MAHRTWLPLKALCGAKNGRLGPMARLEGWLGSHAARVADTFSRNVRLLLKSAAERKKGAQAGELVDREIASLIISSMLRVTAPHTMFMRLHECAGETDVFTVH